MRIEEIHLYHVGMPLVYPFRTSYGDDDAIESLVVHLVGADGEGWGEAAPWRAPGYSPEWAYAAFLTVREWLAPQIVGRDVRSGADLRRHLAGFKGNPFAKAALDTAWWDLDASARGEPLWRAVGGVSPSVTVGADLGVMESVDRLLEAVEAVQAAGFRRLKLKFRPGWDVPVVEAVRRRFPDLPTHIDCNGAYTLADLPMFRALDGLGLAMIEQPLGHDDLVDHALLQAQLTTPICLDESITGADRARQAAEIGACRWVNVKPGRVGGLTEAIAIHDTCAARNIPCWVGGMLESALGQGFSLALATLPNFQYPADIFPSRRFYAADLAEPEIVLSGPSQVTAPDRPGVGYRPHPERLRRQTLHEATIRAGA
jgi:O-succinylbenzoate synthase